MKELKVIHSKYEDTAIVSNTLEDVKEPGERYYIQLTHFTYSEAFTLARFDANGTDANSLDFTGKDAIQLIKAIAFFLEKIKKDENLEHILEEEGISIDFDKLKKVELSDASKGQDIDTFDPFLNDDI